MRTPTRICTHPHILAAQEPFIPNGGRDVGPCSPMSVLEEGKYFHCQGICSCQQSDVCTRLRYAVPMRSVASAAGPLRVRRGLQHRLFPDIRNMVSVNTSRGTDRVRSGCDRRAIAADDSAAEAFVSSSFFSFLFYAATMKQIHCDKLIWQSNVYFSENKHF